MAWCHYLYFNNGDWHESMENMVCPIRLANHEFYQDMFPTGQLGSLEVGLDVSMTFSWGRGRPVVIRAPLWLHVFFFENREVSRSILSFRKLEAQTRLQGLVRRLNHSWNVGVGIWAVCSQLLQPLKRRPPPSCLGGWGLPWKVTFDACSRRLGGSDSFWEWLSLHCKKHQMS